MEQILVGTRRRFESDRDLKRLEGLAQSRERYLDELRVSVAEREAKAASLIERTWDLEDQLSLARALRDQAKDELCTPEMKISNLALEGAYVQVGHAWGG